MNSPLFPRRFVPVFLLVASLALAFSDPCHAAKPNPIELRDQIYQVLQSYRIGRNKLIVGKKKEKSQLLFRNKLKILDNKIKYLEGEYAKQLVIVHTAPRPRPRSFAPALPLAAPARPMGQQFAMETAPLPTVAMQPIAMAPASFARASSAAPAEASLRTPVFGGETTMPGVSREQAVLLPEPVVLEPAVVQLIEPAVQPEHVAPPEPVLLPEPVVQRAVVPVPVTEPVEVEIPVASVTPVPAGMPSFTGKDWMEMDPTYKTLRLLSIMGRLIHYDIIAWKSQSFYAKAIDEAIARDPSLQERNLTWIFFDQLEIHEPETREAVDKIRRNFA